MAVLTWMTFLAGGAYAWVWLPAAAVLAAIAMIVKPPIARAGLERGLDLALIALIVACVVQMIPLPGAIVQAIDPQAIAVRSALWLPPRLSPPDLPWLPISIVPRATLEAAGILLSALIMFWTCRRVCENGGTGRMIRAVAIMGLVASIAAIAQRALRIDLIYGIWRPLDAGARPYGPFVNRNHFATWAIMASPLVFGYLLARAPRDRHVHHFAQRIVHALEQLGTIRAWLAAAVCALSLAVMLSASRSGLIGLLAALMLSAALTRRRGSLAVRRWVFVQFTLLALVLLWFANYDVLMRRFEETMVRAERGRGYVAIWRDAFTLAGDFPATGTGAGTFGTAIYVYQTAEPGYAIDQAHNHYLQLMAEGGAWLLLPGALAAGFFVALASRTLKEDRSSSYLIRAGACAGIIGVLVQSVWETGLTMPANALLFSMLAAIAVHVPVAGPEPARH